MNKRTHFSQQALVFNGKKIPEEGSVVGYAAIICSLELAVPMPSTISLVCKQNKSYLTEAWKVFPNSYLPEDHLDLTEIEALYKHLIFALKYEGVNLLVFSFLAQHYTTTQLTKLVDIEPTGQYSRRIWFIIEWILGCELEGKESLSKKKYVSVIDIKHQYAIKGTKSPRHLVINNLPGTPFFCPLIRRTKKLEQYIKENFSEQKSNYLKDIRKDTLQRASAFLLLKDSKASFTIEGEKPRNKRAVRWGQAIGRAGTKDLTKEELIHLQQVVIENSRFVNMGFREKGGFVGEHDRHTGAPIPEHISARWQDITRLISALEETNELLIKDDIDAVLTATVIAFGFVFIHPFEDGNGRIHRYLIHHILAKKDFSKEGLIFPISAAILDRISDYRKTLEHYSHPLLHFIQWGETKGHNIEVTNETIDYYRYFDATTQAEFLYDCVNDTIKDIIPNEVAYLISYGNFKQFLDDEFEMPDKMVAQLVRFLEQNDGQLSKRARNKEFKALTDVEVETIHQQYQDFFE
jgi:hypothetical protein